MEKWVQEGFNVKCDDVVISIGDYVEYHDSAGKNNSDLYEGKWQVLGAEDGNLLIVSSESIGKCFFNKENTLEDAMEAYVNGMSYLDKMCSVYGKGKGAEYARSITVEDVNRITKFCTDNKYGKEEVIKTVNGTEFVWYDGKSWCYTKKSATVTLKEEYYWYEAMDRMVFTSKSTNSEKVYDMLFGSADNKNYWLASTYVHVNKGFPSFGMRSVCSGLVYIVPFVYSYGAWHRYENDVRAVVKLRKDVQVSPVIKIEKYNIL